MNRNSLLTGMVIGLIFGFSIGFLWTNSANRSALKEMEDKVRQAQAGGGGGQTGSNQAPNDSFHNGMPSDAEINQAITLAAQHREDFEAQTKIGQFLVGVKRFTEARECFEAALKLKPNDYKTLVDLGNVNFDEGKFVDAEGWYQKAIVIKADDPNVRTDLGNTFFSRKPPQFQKAIEHYQESLKINPSHGPTLRNMAVAWMQLNNPTEAKKAVDKLAEIDPQNPELKELQAALSSPSGDTKRDIPTH